MLQWLNENDDVSIEFLYSAYARDKKDKVRCESYLNPYRLDTVGNSYSIIFCYQSPKMSSFSVLVPKEHGTLQLFKFCRGRVHSADPVL